MLCLASISYGASEAAAVQSARFESHVLQGTSSQPGYVSNSSNLLEGVQNPTWSFGSAFEVSETPDENGMYWLAAISRGEANAPDVLSLYKRHHETPNWPSLPDATFELEQIDFGDGQSDVAITQE